jgi:predicted metal-dependent peptidase
MQKLTAKQKMKKARTMLILDDPFYGALSMRMKIRPMSKNIIERAIVNRSCVIDGRQIVYDPRFIDSMSVMEAKGLLAHEISHVALKHNLRRGDRDWKTWNMAGDFVIDPILKKAGFELPDIGNGQRGHFDPEIAGKNTEQAYEILKARKATADKALEDLAKQTADSGDEDDTDTGNPQSGGDQDYEDDEDHENGDKIPKILAPMLPAEKNDEDGTGGADADDGSATQDDEEYTGGFDAPNMPGCGAVLDMPINMQDNTEVDKADEELTLAIEDAYKAAKMHGKMPGEMERLIEKQKEHKIEWHEELRDFMEKALDRGDYNWTSPSRRYLGHGLVLPGLTEDEILPNIVVVCDTSGSIDDRELEQYAGEISNVLEEFECNFKVIYCDTRVCGEQDFSYEDLPIKLDAKGGGGTKFLPAFDYIKKQRIEAEAIVFFTDMDAWDWPDLQNYDPQLPVLWLDSYGDIVNRVGFRLPFGKHILLEMDKLDDDD